MSYHLAFVLRLLLLSPFSRELIALYKHFDTDNGRHQSNFFARVDLCPTAAVDVFVVSQAGDDPKLSADCLGLPFALVAAPTRNSYK
jgi:hypothetical protein